MAQKCSEAYKKFERTRVIYGHKIELPEPPPIEEIANYGEPLAEQYFKPRPFPEDFHEWPKEDRLEYYFEEKRRSLEGFWFFNGGNLEYITGINYFYITYYKIKISEQGKPKRMELPKFLDADRDFFYIWEYVEKAKNIAGLVFITNRRDGKSYKGGCILYHAAIFNEDAHCGIQSKTDQDAKGVMKKIIDSWKRMPYIFRPRDTGELNPTKWLRFEPPSKKDTKGTMKERRNGEKYINSFIDYESSDSYAYDGKDLLRYMLDEAGKPQKSDVNTTLQVVNETLVDGSYVIGKSLVTTTVEEMENQTEDEGIKAIWKKADVNKVNAFNMTENGLIQYFKPCYFGMRGEDENGVPFINKYGYSDWRRAKAYREKKRESLTGNSLVSEIRKYPFNIDEAFQTSHSCYFDAGHLKQHIKYNEVYVNERNLFRGNFHWTRDISHGEVYWQPDPEGKFLVSWLPDKKDRNQWMWVDTEEGRHRSPTRVDCAAGADPFDHKDTADKRKSDAGFHIFRKSGIWDGGEDKDPLTNTFVLEYIHRPPTPEEQYEDIIKACVFYSCRILLETNKSGLDNEFRRQGYWDYVMARPDSLHSDYSRKAAIKRGIAMSGDVPRTKLPNRLMSFVFNDMGKDDTGKLKCFMPFNRTLEDWLKFNPNKWTDFDATVSSMLALAASDVDIKLKKEEEPIVDLLMTYDNSGEISKMI